ncbi:MAG: DUF2442 domain-containing protein [Gemmatimonadaceae bacterium]
MTNSRIDRAEILKQVRAARKQDARDRKAGRRATSASYDRRTGRVMLELTSGFVFGFPAKGIPALANATADQLAAVTVSPGGSGLHWEELDADLSVAGLLLSAVSRSEKLSELARVAGQSRTPAKAAAARVNGAKGGRPRKAAGR